MNTRFFLIALIVAIILPKAEAQSWWENTYSSKELDIGNI
jgi:hypothetical protein